MQSGRSFPDWLASGGFPANAQDVQASFQRGCRLSPRITAGGASGLPKYVIDSRGIPRKRDRTYLQMHIYCYHAPNIVTVVSIDHAHADGATKKEVHSPRYSTILAPDRSVMATAGSRRIVLPHFVPGGKSA
jgi:hypothetical protein